MAHIRPGEIVTDYALPDGGVRDIKIAETGTAKLDDVLTVLGADACALDGYARSQWLWLRLTNGDLFLAVAPQDETYFATEANHPV